MAGERSVCLVCNSVAGTTPVSIHSNLASKTGTIHGRLCEVVGPQDLAEACQVSQVLCAGCLRLLLNIVYLEYRVVVLRDKFRITFHKGAESRRVGLGGSHFKCNSLSTTKEEEFEVVAGELPVDSHGFPETLAAQLTFPSAQELSDLLPRHCLEGGEDLENFQSQNIRDSENNGLKWPDISVKSGLISPVEGQSTKKLDGEGVAEDVEGSSTLGDALSNAEGEESICVKPDLEDMALSETPVLHFTAGDGVRSNTCQPRNTNLNVTENLGSIFKTHFEKELQNIPYSRNKVNILKGVFEKDLKKLEQETELFTLLLESSQLL